MKNTPLVRLITAILGIACLLGGAIWFHLSWKSGGGYHFSPGRILLLGFGGFLLIRAWKGW